MTVSDYKNQQSDDSDGEQQGFYAGGSQHSGNMILGECCEFACFDIFSLTNLVHLKFFIMNDLSISL